MAHKVAPPIDVEMTLSLGWGMRCECCSAQAEYMKNIQTITAAIAALFLASCGSNDIVLTSEVDEKLIIERDTIQLKADSKTYDDALDREIKYRSDIVRTICGYSPEHCSKIKHALAIKHELAVLRYAKKLNKGPVWRQEWRYIPVTRDRNGKETVGEEIIVKCYSPSLTEKAKQALDGYPFTRTVTYSGTTLKDTAARTICAEYAKWE